MPNSLSADHEASTEAVLRRDLLNHLQAIGLLDAEFQRRAAGETKDQIRAYHALQRADYLRRERARTAERWPKLLEHFADGTEVCPSAIDPELVEVKSGHETGDLFRFATLLWSVPVSRGFGRRMRFLVRDRSNGKLIGIFALGDPVFNLRVRDAWIGWTVEDRRTRLVNVMDAYVVGAVPPYSQLLGGKLIAALLGSAEVCAAFERKYSESTGIISREQKQAKLALITVSSALGRSSLYNRVKLTIPNSQPGGAATPIHLKYIGTTLGYGHFQLSEDLFNRLRRLLMYDNHAYFNGHQFGQGPNWRMRVARVALQRLGLDDELLRHGIAREVYALPLVQDFKSYLSGRVAEVATVRPTAQQIAEAALSRWILPRAERRPEYKLFERARLLEFRDVLPDNMSAL